MIIFFFIIIITKQLHELNKFSFLKNNLMSVCVYCFVFKKKQL